MSGLTYHGNVDVSDLSREILKLNQFDWFKYSNRLSFPYQRRTETIPLIVGNNHESSLPLNEKRSRLWFARNVDTLEGHESTEYWDRLGEFVEPVINRAAALVGKTFDDSIRICLTRIQAGCCIPPHKDGGRTWYSARRIHVTLKTNSETSLWSEGEYVFPNVGDVYELDLSTEHAAFNQGFDERIHLMFDLI